jgi:hypothetical protein
MLKIFEMMLKIFEIVIIMLTFIQLVINVKRNGWDMFNHGTLIIMLVMIVLMVIIY